MAKVVPLSKGEGAIIVDDDDYEAVARYRWRLVKGYPARTWKEEGRTRAEYLHQMLMGRRDGYQIDHRNQNPLDNRRANLRWATASENCANRGCPTGSSKYRGVAWHGASGKWLASLKHQRKQHYLGVYETEEAAARAYDKKAKDLFGEFARLNFPD